jgi:hypothetical protein
MSIALANETSDLQDKKIRARQEDREALRARLFGAQREPRATPELIGRLEAQVRALDLEIRALLAERPETPLRETGVTVA